MHEQIITAQIFGTEAVKVRPKAFAPRLLLDGATVDKSNFIAMLPAQTVEATFITSVPKNVITRYRYNGSHLVDFTG